VTKRAVSRCAWAGNDPLMQAYHDEEWGVPERDPHALWEMLMLEGFQAGLSWAIVLRKREAFRNAFKGFDPDAVARYTARDVNRLLKDPGIIRARAKIEATIAGARIFREMRDAGESFTDFCWSFTDGRVMTGDGRAVPAHIVVRKDLKGTEAPRLQVRRANDRLRLDAGGRHRQRPCPDLFSSQAGSKVVKGGSAESA
jgi:DNA-3-methyladenine glycosylase I